MSRLLFPSRYLTDENQELLEAILDEFGYLDDYEGERITVERALEDLYCEYHYDNKVIEIPTDDYYDFGEITAVLLSQRISYDLIHASDYESNSSVEFFRDYMKTPFHVTTDLLHNPTITIKHLRQIMDSQDEHLSDLEVINALVEELNYSDFLREGNRIQDVA